MTVNNNLSVRQMAKWLKKIHVTNGDVLAVKSNTSLADKVQIDQIATALDRMGVHQCIVVVVDDFNDLSVLNETEMNKRGWFNIKKLAKFSRIPKKEEV